MPASLQLCKVRILCVTLARLSSHLYPPFFSFQEAVRRSIRSPSSSLLPEQQKETTAVPTWCVFCLFGFCSFQWKQRRKKQISACGYMCVCVFCVAVCVFFYRSKQCVVVWGLGKGGLYPIIQTHTNAHTHTKLVTHSQTSVYNIPTLFYSLQYLNNGSNEYVYVKGVACCVTIITQLCSTKHFSVFRQTTLTFRSILTALFNAAFLKC